MIEGPRRVLAFKRRRTGRTNYRRRMKLLLSGIPRIVIRPTNKNLIVQIIEYDFKDYKGNNINTEKR